MRGQFRPPLGQFAVLCAAFVLAQPPCLDKRQRAAGKRQWELEVVVRRNGNCFADVLYSALFNKTLGVVMWTVVLFVMCLIAPFLSAPLLYK